LSGLFKSSQGRHTTPYCATVELVGFYCELVVWDLLGGKKY